MRKEYPRRVLPGKVEKHSAIAIWDGPESLPSVLRLKGKGRLSIVHPKDAEGKPKAGSDRNCLRIERPDRVTVAHPGDLVVTDWNGNFDVMHGYEWAMRHGYFKAYEGDEDFL